MKTEDSPISPMSENSYCRQFDGDGQTNPPAKSTDGNHRCEGLSSTDGDSLQTEEAYGLPVICNTVDDISAALKSGAKSIEIPDELMQHIRDNYPNICSGCDPGEMGNIGIVY